MRGLLLSGPKAVTMTRWKTCAGCTTRSSCPNVVPVGVSRCDTCNHEAEQRRGTPTERGYGRAHRAFRRAVLHRDPTCTHPDGCAAPSVHADHYPLSLRELRALGVNPYDPARGRGLCHQHHSTETARHQPGGWAAEARHPR